MHSLSLISSWMWSGYLSHLCHCGFPTVMVYNLELWTKLNHFSIHCFCQDIWLQKQKCYKIQSFMPSALHSVTSQFFFGCLQLRPKLKVGKLRKSNCWTFLMHGPQQGILWSSFLLSFKIFLFPFSRFIFPVLPCASRRTCHSGACRTHNCTFNSTLCV